MIEVFYNVFFYIKFINGFVERYRCEKTNP